MRTGPALALVLALLVAAALPCSGQGVPAQWHQPLTPGEIAWTSRIVTILKTAPEFPEVRVFHIFPGAAPQMQFNAWEQYMEIYVPVEIVRFVENDPDAFAFLLAHEAGHAKQEQIYGQSCYTASDVTMSQSDWDQLLRDTAAATATRATRGTAGVAAAASAQKQACEDNADAWAVKFTREAGLDPAGGIRLFSRLRQVNANSYSTRQSATDNPVSEERIAHIAQLISGQLISRH